MKALEVNNVSKHYGELKALDGVSFSIDQGGMFALLGPNGSGKTTLISVISTLLEGDEGSVSVFGNIVSPDKMESKRILGLVPQEIVNHGFFNVEEILQFISGYYGLYKNKERCDYLLDRLALTEHRHKLVNQLSGGMKRRLLIAKALVHRPRLLLLDEPTAGVDIELRNSLWDFVRELNKEEGLSILLTTHYLEEAEELCENVAIISRGKVLQTGNTKELIKSMTNREVIFYTSQNVPNCESPFLISNEGRKLRFRIPQDMNLGMLLQGLELERSIIEDIQIKEGSLEDAFLSVVRASK